MQFFFIFSFLNLQILRKGKGGFRLIEPFARNTYQPQPRFMNSRPEPRADIIFRS